MLFNSPLYIFVFLPFVIIVYYALNRRRLTTAGKTWLVIASLFFYGYWEAQYLLLILGSMLTNYAIGISLHRSKLSASSKNKRHHTPSRRALFAFGVLFNLALLGYFKYINFFLDNINIFTSTQIPPMHVVLPLAISFFTFQQIAYLADCYKTDTQEYDFLSYCLFVTFFPQLIAGPIVHHNEMMPQFQSNRTKVINWRNISAGIFIFFIGLFKKVVVADSFAIWANSGFDANIELLFLHAWGTSLSYTFQLYYDFSGYSDMAIGAALMLNIRLPVNFNSPYKATNIQEFWHRWHMTLSRWLRDYVYIPLGGNREGSVRTYFNIIVTFLLGGLWHGAGWTFVVWGAMHGLAITVHRYWTSIGLRTNKFLGWLLTFLFVNCSWVFFRAGSFEDAIRVLRGMTGINGIEHSANFLLTANVFTRFDSALYAMFLPNGIIAFVLAVKYLIVFGLVAFLFPNTVQITGFMPYSGNFSFRRSIGQAALLGVAMFLSILTFTGGVTSSEFLYFNF